MTEYVLPFTCKQAVKTLKVIYWIGLIVFPCLLVYSWMENPNPIKELQSHDTHDYRLALSLLGTTTLWTIQIMYKLITLAENGDLPSFRCKCESDEKPKTEAVK